LVLTFWAESENPKPKIKSASKKNLFIVKSFL
jgi:hypothetical protein